MTSIFDSTLGYPGEGPWRLNRKTSAMNLWIQPEDREDTEAMPQLIRDPNVSKRCRSKTTPAALPEIAGNDNRVVTHFQSNIGSFEKNVHKVPMGSYDIYCFQEACITANSERRCKALALNLGYKLECATVGHVSWKNSKQNVGYLKARNIQEWWCCVCLS